MTGSYVRHDSFLCKISHLRMCHMTPSHAWHDSFTCVTFLPGQVGCAPRDSFLFSYAWHDSLTHVTWLLGMCHVMCLVPVHDVTPWYAPHDCGFIWVSRLQGEVKCQVECVLNARVQCAECLSQARRGQVCSMPEWAECCSMPERAECCPMPECSVLKARVKSNVCSKPESSRILPNSSRARMVAHMPLICIAHIPLICIHYLSLAVFATSRKSLVCGLSSKEMSSLRRLRMTHEPHMSYVNHIWLLILFVVFRIRRWAP